MYKLRQRLKGIRSPNPTAQFDPPPYFDDLDTMGPGIELSSTRRSEPPPNLNDINFFFGNIQLPPIGSEESRFFTRFTHLPSEIQNRIFRLSARPRILEICVQARRMSGEAWWCRINDNLAQPAESRICRRSRALFLAESRLIHHHGHSRPIYLNRELDTVLFRRFEPGEYPEFPPRNVHTRPCQTAPPNELCLGTRECYTKTLALREDSGEGRPHEFQNHDFSSTPLVDDVLVLCYVEDRRFPSRRIMHPYDEETHYMWESAMATVGAARHLKGWAKVRVSVAILVNPRLQSAIVDDTKGFILMGPPNEVDMLENTDEEREEEEEEGEGEGKGKGKGEGKGKEKEKEKETEKLR